MGGLGWDYPAGGREVDWGAEARLGWGCCMSGQFFDMFTDADSVFYAFDVSAADRQGVEIRAAQYDCEQYEGSASVLFRQHGALFEAYGSHCSCNGLDGCWRPEPVEVAELRARAIRRAAEPGHAESADYWRAVIAILDGGAA